MHDLFKNMNSQEFISIIKAEAECQGVACMSNATNLVYSTKAKNNKSKGQSLFKRIMSKLKDTKANDNNKEQSDKKPKKLYYKHCKTREYTANDCNKWDEDPCTHCRQFNHEAKDCWHKDKLKQNKGKGKGNSCKRARNEETNAMDSNSQLSAIMIKMPGNVAPGRITFNSSEHGQHFNFTDYNVTNYNGIDEHTLYYDWLADSATTSHIVNWHDVTVLLLHKDSILE